MGTKVKVNGVVANPPAGMRKIEKDRAIVRGVALGMLDWSNPDTYQGSGTIAGLSTFHNLVAGGADAIAQANSSAASLAGVSGGLLRGDGSVSAGGYPYVRLPAAWNFDADVTEALDIIWLDLPASGWPASGLVGIFGSGVGNGASLQRHLYLQADASGNAVNLTFRKRGTSGNIDLAVTGSALASILDSAPHQIGIAQYIIGGQGHAVLYKADLGDAEAEVLATGSSGAMTAFNQPGGNPMMFGAPGVGQMTTATTPAGSRLGRISTHNLTGRDDVTVEGLLAADLRGAAGFITA